MSRKSKQDNVGTWRRGEDAGDENIKEHQEISKNKTFVSEECVMCSSTHIGLTVFDHFDHL